MGSGVIDIGSVRPRGLMGVSGLRAEPLNRLQVI
jgi:hypothetical protein